MLIAVNYHYVRPVHDYPYPGVHGITPAQFESQLRLLGAAGTFVSAEQIRAAVDGERELPARSIVITFDDGLREQYEHAWPVLERLGIPAIFFINTWPIAERRVLPVHKIHLVRAHLEPGEFLSYVENQMQMLGIAEQGADNQVRATEHYKYDSPQAARLKYLLNFELGECDRDAMISELFTRLFPQGEQAVSEQLYMSREQIAQLGRQRSIGSHSHEHLPLGLLPAEAITDQIARGSDYLGQWAGYRPYALSFPYGSREACSPQAANIARDAGISFGFSMERAANADLSNPLQLARFDNNDLPGGKQARCIAETMFDALPTAEWFIAAAQVGAQAQRARTATA